MNQRQDQTSTENRNARRIAFVQACWHKEIVDRCRQSFTAVGRDASQVSYDRAMAVITDAV